MCQWSQQRWHNSNKALKSTISNQLIRSHTSWCTKGRLLIKGLFGFVADYFMRRRSPQKLLQHSRMYNVANCTRPGGHLYQMPPELKHLSEGHQGRGGRHRRRWRCTRPQSQPHRTLPGHRSMNNETEVAGTARSMMMRRTTMRTTMRTTRIGPARLDYRRTNEAKVKNGCPPQIKPSPPPQGAVEQYSKNTKAQWASDWWLWRTILVHEWS